MLPGHPTRNVRQERFHARKQRANKHSEKREYSISWAKEGVKPEHFSPDYERIKELPW
jgi:hypothetical protein